MGRSVAPQRTYLKGDIEGLEMTLLIIQLNEVGRIHRLAIHKGGWRHDSERGNHEIRHPIPRSNNPWRLLSCEAKHLRPWNLAPSRIFHQMLLFCNCYFSVL